MKRERLMAALSAAGAVLKRQKKHLVYVLPNGKSFTVSATPSDCRAEDNALTDLRHALGAEPRAAVVNPPRERRAKPGRRDDDGFLKGKPSTSPLAAALSASGVKAEAELVKAREVERELRWHILALEADLALTRRQLAALESLRIVKFWRWWGGC